MLALYLVANDPISGVNVVLPGRIDTDPATGQITTTFDDNPQLPFEALHLELKSGPRAPITAPSTCATYTTHSTFTGWSGKVVQGESSFSINQNCGGGFNPKLSAGTQNPLAGTTSPFSLRLTREDGTEELGRPQPHPSPRPLRLPEGHPLLPRRRPGRGLRRPRYRAWPGSSPSCPAASQVGTVTVGAGAGVNPFYTSSGRAYLAGPYKGAPLSLAVVAPAVAGPFDLGSVVVRNALRIDPASAQITAVSDPLPQILHGIPLDLRDVRVKLDRPDFTLNPTSCEPMQIGSSIASTTGAIANPSSHFQVAGCDRLGFKPKLSLKLSGATHRAAHPALRAVLTMPRKGTSANISGASVLLPTTELLENAHIRTICTRVQYTAEGGGGAGCPKGSVYGYARAWTPLLDQPLEGPVYLRANGGERELPDLVASLGGQIHIDLVGYVDGVHGRIRNRFLTAPDAPVSKFELRMEGGKKGLLANETDICKAKPRALVSFGAHNGKTLRLAAPVKGDCGGEKRKRVQR